MLVWILDLVDALLRIAYLVKRPEVYNGFR